MMKTNGNQPGDPIVDMGPYQYPTTVPTNSWIPWNPGDYHPTGSPYPFLPGTYRYNPMDVTTTTKIIVGDQKKDEKKVESPWRVKDIVDEEEGRGYLTLSIDLPGVERGLDVVFENGVLGVNYGRFDDESDECDSTRGYWYDLKSYQNSRIKASFRACVLTVSVDYDVGKRVRIPVDFE